MTVITEVDIVRMHECNRFSGNVSTPAIWLKAENDRGESVTIFLQGPEDITRLEAAVADMRMKYEAYRASEEAATCRQ
jgi:hypothetical protein